MDYEEYSPMPDRCETCEQLRAENARLRAARMPDEMVEAIRELTRAQTSARVGCECFTCECARKLSNWLDAIEWIEANGKAAS